MNRDLLSPAQVRRLTGVSRKALRLYEERGLLTPPIRTYTGWRRYPPAVVDEVRFIRSALAVGLHLEDLKPALAAWRKGKSPCSYLLPSLQARLAEVDARLQALTRQRQHLQVLIEAWDCLCPPTSEVCPQIAEVMHQVS